MLQNFCTSDQGVTNCTHLFLFPHDFAVPFNNHQDGVARSLRDLTMALRHRYLHTPLQPVGDEQLAVIQSLEKIFCPELSTTSSPLHQLEVPPPVTPSPAPPLPTQPPHMTPVSIQPIVEIPTTTIPTQLSQHPVPVSLSPLSQDNANFDYDRHRYPTRFSLSQKNYSMACTSKYTYAAAHLATLPAPSVHGNHHMVCPVIDPDTGASLEYRHLLQGPDKDIWIKVLANDFSRLA